MGGEVEEVRALKHKGAEEEYQGFLRREAAQLDKLPWQARLKWCAEMRRSLGLPAGNLELNAALASDDDEGRKDDAGKPRWTLLPWDALGHVVEVLEYGATKKYTPDGWKKVTDWRQRYSDALLRHWVAWSVRGEWLDPESRLPHLAHLTCNALFLLALGAGAERVK